MAFSLKTKKSAAACLFLSTVIWGVSFPVIKLAVGEVDSLLFINIRFAIAAAIVLAYLLIFRRPLRKLLRGRVLWILGITNGVGFAMEVFGMNFTSASKASLLINVNVVFMAIFSSLLLGDTMRRKAKAGIGIGLAGVVLTSTGGDLSVLTSGSIIGDVIIFTGGIVWAYSMIYNKKAATELGLSAMEVTASMTLISALALLPFLGLSSFNINVNAVSIAAIFYTAIFCTIVAFFLFYKSLQTLTVVNSGMVMLFEIVIAIAVSSIFLGEVLTVVGALGGVLIGLGIWLAS